MKVSPMKVNDAVVLAGASGASGARFPRPFSKPQAEEFLPGCRGKPFGEPQRQGGVIHCDLMILT
jgi:hypothetical protein